MAAHPLSLLVNGWIHLKLPANMLQHEANRSRQMDLSSNTVLYVSDDATDCGTCAHRTVQLPELDPDLLTLLSRLQPVISSNLIPPNNLFLLGSSEPLVHILGTWNIEVRFHQW